MEIRPVDGQSPGDLEATRALFREYERAIGVDLCFQGFAEELAGLPGAYGPPGGRLLLAAEGEIPVGCVGVRPLAGEVAELRRLYVRSLARGQGLGRRLLEAAIAASRALGYRRLRLETLATMKEAIALYRSRGFAPVPPRDGGEGSGEGADGRSAGPPHLELELRF